MPGKEAILMRYIEEEIQVKYPRGTKKDGYQPVLCCYLQNRSEDLPGSGSRPAVIVCPGGAYRCKSEREGEPVALRFLAAGMQAFVMQYSVAPSEYPCALLELAAAVAMVRQNSEAWNVDPDRVILCGFSAGGHLCACLGTLWRDGMFAGATGYEPYSWKPDGMILCYPVISMELFSHEECRKLLLGERQQELKGRLSLQKRVSGDTVPAFLWCTQEDEEVPMENTLLFAAALRASRVPFELHIYETGVHGLALCNEITANRPQRLVQDDAGWVDLAVRWIRRRRGTPSTEP